MLSLLIKYNPVNLQVCTSYISYFPHGSNGGFRYVNSFSTTATNGVGSLYLLFQENELQRCKKPSFSRITSSSSQKKIIALFHLIQSICHSPFANFGNYLVKFCHTNIIYYVTFQYATLNKPCISKDANQVPSTSESDSETPKHHPQSRMRPSPSMNEPS